MVMLTQLSSNTDGHLCQLSTAKHRIELLPTSNYVYLARY